MSQLLSLASVCCLAAVVSASPLDDYVSAPDEHFNWTDTGVRITGMPLGGEGHLLNVTSQKWLDETKQAGPDGTAIWTHQVVVIVPSKFTVKNVSMAYITGSCNKDPSTPSGKSQDIIIADAIAHSTEGLAMVVFQIPNCPIIYPADPEHKPRSEDAMIAFAWHSFLELDPTHNPEWLPRLPMVKGAMQCMRAVQEYTKAAGLADLVGFVVAGASKRGWTTWLVGAVQCPTCPRILAIVPVVPIAPDIVKVMHRQWRSYNGFTFAFSDYVALNITEKLDSPGFGAAMSVVDPYYYADRLALLPKVVILSSDDEFMQMDWSDMWYDQWLPEEKHLLIVPNTEHSLASGLPEVLETMGAFVRSVALGHTERPTFAHERNLSTGEVTVTIPEKWRSKYVKVVLRHAETLQSKRRDFRWVRQSNAFSGKCKLPDIPLKHPFLGGNCLQPIVWLGKTLKEAEPGTYRTGRPPKPLIHNHWTGYFVEVYFPSGTGMRLSKFQFTTPGYVWPDTLPFQDCHDDTCVGRLL